MFHAQSVRHDSLTRLPRLHRERTIEIKEQFDLLLDTVSIEEAIERADSDDAAAPRLP